MPLYARSPAELSPEAITCRSLRRHPFEVVDDFHLHPDYPGLILRTLRCRSCQSPALDVYTVRPVTALHSVLERAAPRRIAYADGYLLRPTPTSLPADASSTREAVDFEVCRRALALLSDAP